MDSTTLGSEKRSFYFPFHISFLSLLIAAFDFFNTVEFATLTLDAATKAPRAKVYRPAEVDALLRQHDLAKKDDDNEMRS